MDLLEHQPSAYDNILSGGNIFHDIGHWFSHEMDSERRPGPLNPNAPGSVGKAGQDYRQQQQRQAAAAQAAQSKACEQQATGVINKFMQNQQNARVSQQQSQMAQASEQVYDRNYGPGSDAISPYA
jgi:hypothetical protein